MNQPEALGRYRLIERIASGGMADVYLARDTLLYRQVIIKRLRPPSDDAQRFVAMFMDEARTVAAFNDPHIVQIYDIGVEDDVPFMAMESLRGWDLRTVLRELRSTAQHMDLGVALRLISDAGRGLHTAHMARSEEGQPLRLVHRDVSPHNLFVTVDGVLKIVDFGIAKSTVQARESTIGELKGKFPYMSPEQVEGGELDRRSDIFSLGLVLHELLTGVSVFAGRTPLECMNEISSCEIAIPQCRERPVPDEVVRVTMRALQRSPARRYQSAAAFAEALALVAGELGHTCDTGEVAEFMGRLFGQKVDPRAAELTWEWTTQPAAVQGRVDLDDALDDSTTRGKGLPPVDLPPPPMQLDRSLTDLSNSHRRRLGARRSDLRGVSRLVVGLTVGAAAVIFVARSGVGQDQWMGSNPESVVTRTMAGLLDKVAAMTTDGDAAPTGPAKVVAAAAEGASDGTDVAVQTESAGDDVTPSTPHGEVGGSLDGPQQAELASEPLTPAGAALVPAETAADAAVVDVPDAVAPPTPVSGRVAARGRRGRFVRLHLAWTPVAGATAYQVQLSRSPEFEQVDIAVETHGVAQVKRNKVRAALYYWRVRAKFDGGAGTFGPASALDARPPTRPGGQRARQFAAHP